MEEHSTDTSLCFDQLGDLALTVRKLPDVVQELPRHSLICGYRSSNVEISLILCSQEYLAWGAPASGVRYYHITVVLLNCYSIRLSCYSVRISGRLFTVNSKPCYKCVCPQAHMHNTCVHRSTASRDVEGSVLCGGIGFSVSAAKLH